MVRIKIIVMAACIFCFANIASAQMSYGFRAGLNYSKAIMPAEDNETLDNVRGFHFGLLFKYNFVDNFAIRFEPAYTQMGVTKRYEGPSYLVLKLNNTTLFLEGQRKQNISVINNYLHFPLLASVRFFDRIELFGGPYAAFSISSTGGGSLTFEGSNPRTNKFTINLDHNYKRDKVGDDAPLLQKIQVSGLSYEVPQTSHAYYELEEAKDNLYKTLDYGITTGISFFFNKGLYFSGRMNYGFADITANGVDAKLASYNFQNLQFSDDVDRNFSLEFSVGFSF